jgi:hypothetical protein
MTQSQMAHNLGVDQATISRDLAAIEKEWRASAVKDFGHRRAMELARIDRVEAQAWDSFDKSCQDAERVSVATVKGRAASDGTRLPDLTRVCRTVESRYGNPAFLEIICRCMELRSRMLGLHDDKTPKKDARGEASAIRRDSDAYFVKLREAIAKYREQVERHRELGEAVECEVRIASPERPTEAA